MKRISNDESVSPKTILKDYQRYFHLGTLNHVTTETNINYEPTSLNKVVFQTYVADRFKFKYNNLHKVSLNIKNSNYFYADHITSYLLKAVFHKFYLVHSWILCPIFQLLSFNSISISANKQKNLLFDWPLA